MSSDKREEIRRLHEIYVRVTGLRVSLDIQGYREMLWFEWLRSGFTAEDLAAVARFVKGCIRRGDRGFNLGTLRFNALIGQPDRFGELLAEAGATSRSARGNCERASVLRATGRDGDAGMPDAKRVGEVAQKIVSDPVKAEEAFREFLKLKESL